MSADHVLFNSKFHMKIFIEKLHSFLSHFPDYNEKETIKIIEKKSEVLSLAIELKNLIHTNMLNIINLYSLEP